MKGRQLGGDFVPFGSVWRLGADEATKIEVSQPTKFQGGPELKPGSYALFAIPTASKWTMIVDKKADQWGAFSYDQSQDLGRFDVPVERSPSPVEEFTIMLTKQSDRSAKVTFAWGNYLVSTMLMVA